MIKRIKKVLPLFCCLAFLLAVQRINYEPIAFASNVCEAPEAKKAMAQDDYSLTEPSQITKPDVQALLSDETIQYYAYLNLDTAEDALRPIIITARNKIIYRHSWVADEADGEILDQAGNVKEVLPHFSELFPSDWEVPVEFQELDLSYYT